MKRCIWIALGWTALFFVASAGANDSIARVGAGGLILLKTDQIQMVQEELQISPGSVKVHYRFLYETSQDIKTTVAFPMPPYGFISGL